MTRRKLLGAAAIFAAPLKVQAESREAEHFRIRFPDFLDEDCGFANIVVLPSLDTIYKTLVINASGSSQISSIDNIKINHRAVVFRETPGESSYGATLTTAHAGGFFHEGENSIDVTAITKLRKALAQSWLIVLSQDVFLKTQRVPSGLPIDIKFNSHVDPLVYQVGKKAVTIRLTGEITPPKDSTKLEDGEGHVIPRDVLAPGYGFKLQKELSYPTKSFRLMASNENAACTVLFKTEDRSGN